MIAPNFLQDLLPNNGFIKSCLGIVQFVGSSNWCFFALYFFRSGVGPITSQLKILKSLSSAKTLIMDLIKRMAFVSLFKGQYLRLLPLSICTKNWKRVLKAFKDQNMGVWLDGLNKAFCFSMLASQFGNPRPIHTRTRYLFLKSRKS
jgi:hypothetical protein